MGAKTLCLIFLLMLFAGCQTSEQASVGSGASSSDANGGNVFDSVPVAYDLIENNIFEDNESGFIFLSYTDAENHQAVSCHIFERKYLTVTTPCTCSSGICYTRVKPSQDYSGPVSFKYSVTANNLTSLPATVDFIVMGVSDIPVANPHAVSLVENTTYVSDGTISKPNLKGTDGDGDPYICLKVTDPSVGVVTVNPDCTFSYTPPLNYEGEDSFTFKINDGTFDSAPATVSITVTHLNTPPVMVGGSLTVYQNVAATYALTNTDPDPDTFIYYVVSAPKKGTASISGSTLTYTPQLNYRGTDSLTLMVSDIESNSNVVTLNITVQSTTIYLRTTGDDSTGTFNDPSLPYLTAQAAADAASALSPTIDTPVIIDVGAGSFGDLNFSYNFGAFITWIGQGAGTSIIGNIDNSGTDGLPGTNVGDPAMGDWDGEPGTNGRSITILSDLSVTFGNVTSNGGNGGAHFPDPIDYESIPGDPGNAGELNLTGIFGAISAQGGSGHAAGSGGTITLGTGSSATSVNASGGGDICTEATFCGTGVPSGSGGNITLRSGSTVSGNVVSRGGHNNGTLVATAVYLAGSGGSINIFGSVGGDVLAQGGDTVDSQVGEGGKVDVKSTGVVAGTINVQSGTTSRAGDQNVAGYVEISGSAQDIYANAIAGFGGGDGEVVVRGTAKDIYLNTDVLSCDIAASGTALIYIPGTVANIYAQGGDASCTQSTAGKINIFGTVTGTVNVTGGQTSVNGVPAGKGGKIRLNNGANVNILTARGGNAVAPSCEDGGQGGFIETYPGSTYNVLNFNVTGGAGDTGCGNGSGAAGTINEY